MRFPKVFPNIWPLKSWNTICNQRRWIFALWSISIRLFEFFQSKILKCLIVLVYLQIVEFFFFDVLCDWLLKNNTVFRNWNVVMTISFSIIFAMYDSFSWKDIYNFLWWFFRRQIFTVAYLFRNFSCIAYGVAREPLWLVNYFYQWYLKTWLKSFKTKPEAFAKLKVEFRD